MNRFWLAQISAILAFWLALVSTRLAFWLAFLVQNWGITPFSIIDQ